VRALTHPSIELVLSVRRQAAAGNGLSATGTAMLMEIFDRMLLGDSWEQATDLGPWWRQSAKVELGAAAITTIDDRGESVLSEARRIRLALAAYVDAGRYDRDLLATTKAEPTWYDLMVGSGGSVPSVETLQRRIRSGREFVTYPLCADKPI